MIRCLCTGELDEKLRRVAGVARKPRPGPRMGPLRVMSNLGISGGIEDILITLADQYHIIRPVGETLFLYVAIDRKRGNLAMARHTLASIPAEVIVP